jgi:predicted DNA-binding transcriptional regulator AlpA
LEIVVIEHRVCARVEQLDRSMKTPREILQQARAITALAEGRENTPSAEKRRRERVAAEYVSAETLSQLLDCSKTTVHRYVRRGILPRPKRIGELVRWRWIDVERSIESLENGTESHADHDDPYLEGLERGPTEEASH